MSARLQPALWGGLFIGVLSALPLVNLVNVCCCLWVIAGGALTSYLTQERSPVPITAGDGAIAGLTAGAIGAVISWIAAVGFWLVTGMGGPEAFQSVLSSGQVPPEVAQMMERFAGTPGTIWFGVDLLFKLVIYPIFALLGGLLGVAMFKKNLPPAPPGTIDVTPIP